MNSCGIRTSSPVATAPAITWHRPEVRITAVLHTSIDELASEILNIKSDDRRSAVNDATICAQMARNGHCGTFPDGADLTRRWRLASLETPDRPSELGPWLRMLVSHAMADSRPSKDNRERHTSRKAALA
jgi:hypothetical protein